MAFIALERLINFHEGYRRVFIVDHQQILLMKSSGKSYAIQAFCPHKHWSFLDAIVEGEVIICPQHHAKFSLSDGVNLTPCEVEGDCLAVYSVVFEGVYVGIDGTEGYYSTVYI